jgi:hypothetical protein
MNADRVRAGAGWEWDVLSIQHPASNRMPRPACMRRTPMKFQHETDPRIGLASAGRVDGERSSRRVKPLESRPAVKPEVDAASRTPRLLWGGERERGDGRGRGRGRGR